MFLLRPPAPKVLGSDKPQLDSRCTAILICILQGCRIPLPVQRYRLHMGIGQLAAARSSGNMPGRMVTTGMCGAQVVTKGLRGAKTVTRGIGCLTAIRSSGNMSGRMDIHCPNLMSVHPNATDQELDERAP